MTDYLFEAHIKECDQCGDAIGAPLIIGVVASDIQIAVAKARTFMLKSNQMLGSFEVTRIELVKKIDC